MAPSKNAATYNGWKNYETWNVALYIANDEPMYRFAQRCVRANRRNPYAVFIEGKRGERTPDGVAWHSRKVSRREVNEAMREMVS